ncbi:MAG: beta-lactamase family protein [Bacteroidales bacterium]|nr:beta-lactamase family protein [Bacteroidales bacterium]
MTRSKYIFAIASLIIALALYYYQSNIRAADISNEEVVVKKVNTKMDSLIFEYNDFLSHEIDSFGSVGAALVITYKGEIAYKKCFGVKEAAGNDSIDCHTIFRLASVSKTITGVLAGILSEEKIIDLDDKVIDYIPGFKLKDSLNTYNLSIREILSHTSGLVPHAYDNLVEAQVPFSVIMDSLYRVNISGEPGELYGYQNVIFSLYDTISAIKTSKNFNELLQEKVFSPFGMANASAGFSPFFENENKAYPHAKHGGSFKKLELNDRYYNTNPAAGINASISDMGQFLLSLSGNENKVLNRNVPNEVFTPQVVSPLRWNYLRKWGKVESKHYALGWRIIGYQGRQIAYHGGYVQGYQAEIALCMEEDFGIAFLTNSPNGVGSISIPTFLDMYFEKFSDNKAP